MSAAGAQAATHALVAALLDAGRQVHLYSCVLSALSLAGLATGVAPLPAALLVVAALLGAAETYLAVRVGFDAAIFRLAVGGDWEAIDGGLADLGLVAPHPAPRSNESRHKGAMRLLRLQGAATILQFLLLLVVLALRI